MTFSMMTKRQLRAFRRTLNNRPEEPTSQVIAKEAPSNFLPLSDFTPGQTYQAHSRCSGDVVVWDANGKRHIFGLSFFSFFRFA